MYFETTGLNTPELAPSFYTAMEDPEELKTQSILDENEQQNDIVKQLFEDDMSYYANADHVIFVIHGIGQQTEQYGMFHTHMKSLRENMQQVLATRMPQEDIRIKMIPIEWHRHIHSETDEWVHRVMPKNIPTVRLIESDYLSDVMYYFTKERGQSIINHVTKSFNQSYHDFMEQQPNFNGKISILGYSLGGLITWDILSHQRQDLTTQEMEQLTKFDVKVPKLDFKPDYLFGMGCPLAGLLIARNQDPRYYHPDYSTVFENIYHPMDPLAFRLEPLLNHEFEEPPVALERAIAQQPTSFASLVFSLFRGTSTTTNNTSSHSKNIPGGTVATQQQGGGILSSLLGYFYSSSSTQENQQEQPQRRASEGDILRLKKPEPMTKPLQQRHRSQSMPSLATRANLPLGMTGASSDEEEGGGIMMMSPEKESMVVMPTPSLSATPTSSCPTTAPQTPTAEQHETPLLSKNDSHCWKMIDLDRMDDDEEDATTKIPLPLGRRYDYELTPDSYLGMISNEYILGLRAHFSYWTNKDMHWHIFCRMEGIDH